MKKIKKFVQDHKMEIMIVGFTSVAVGAGFVLGRNSKKFVDPYLGKNVLSWISTGKFISMEEAKSVIDLNGMGEGVYALVQEAPNVFVWVACNDKVLPL